MITAAEAPRTDNRVIAITVAASILVHATVLVVALLASDQFGRFFVRVVPRAVATQPPQDEIVTISRAVRIAPKPTLERTLQSRFAYAQRTPHPFLPHAVSRAVRGQLAAFQRALARMELEHPEADFLKVSPDPAAAPKRYRLQLQGKLGHLRRGEGIYYPIKGWRSGNFDYYYVAYQFTHADGTIESGYVPWPIHFTPDSDPFVSTDVALLQRTPLPPPPAGFVPPGDLGKALRYYFPNMQFEDAAN